MALSRTSKTPITILAALLGVILFAPPGQALAGEKQAPGKKTGVSVPMAVVGFDPEVAAANGYPTTPPVSTQGTVTGNCGFSYVELYDAGVRRYRMDTQGTVTSAVCPASVVA